MTPQEIHTEIINQTKSKRLQYTRIIDLVGVTVLTIGAINFSDAVQFLPESWVPWVVGIGAMMARAQALILFIGDFNDDGIINHSYKIPK